MYGFQCHLEFTPESIAELVNVSDNEFSDNDDHHYIQNPEYILNSSSLRMNSLLVEFMDKLMIEYTRRASRTGIIAQ